MEVTERERIELAAEACNDAGPWVKWSETTEAAKSLVRISVIAAIRAYLESNWLWQDRLTEFNAAAASLDDKKPQS